MATSKKKVQKRKATSRQSSGAPSPQKAKETFACSCTQRCKGRLKQLTRVTYLKHAQFREIDAQREAQAEAHKVFNLPTT
jgi:hypothetical protein